METSIVESKLTDGSTVYDVVFVDGAQKVVIAADSAAGACRLRDAFTEHAMHATIEVHKDDDV